MFKRTFLSTLIGYGVVLNSYAMNPQEDPLNPTGFIVSQSEIQAAEDAKTLDPMYDIWAQALRTQPNTVVDAIEPG